MSEDILAEALRLTSDDRQASYGPPWEDYAKVSAIWSAILGVKVSAKQAQLCMIGVKLARLAFGDSRDSAVDIAGYIRCYWLTVEHEREAEDAALAYTRPMEWLGTDGKRYPIGSVLPLGVNCAEPVECERPLVAGWAERNLDRAID